VPEGKGGLDAKSLIFICERAAKQTLSLACGAGRRLTLTSE